MKSSKLRIGALTALFALFFALVGAGTALALQNHMLSARSSLNTALSELQQAQPDKGGHRNNAINYTKQAIAQVSLGIQFAK
ncbi:MAG: hypothetical protein JO146_06075 [Candidatus Eremiobacteraeota bacterium]|nr:hypothetical protein [Candidatus Eremiobacteraeota bacterium]